MKKILVTGAAGIIGMEVIKYLLSEGKYEVTAIDFKNSRVHAKFRKYKKRVNVIYGDVSNRMLMESLVKDHDVVIHLASVLPPLASINKELSEEVIYKTTDNLVRAINYYNPDCHFIYASTTSVYGDKNDVSSKSKVSVKASEYYASDKLKVEKIIHEKLKRYTIVRVPLVISSNIYDNFIYSVPKNNIVSMISSIDAGYAFVKIIDKLKMLNRKTINISGDSEFTMKYMDVLRFIVRYRGLSYKLLFSDMLLSKNYYSPLCTDTEKYNDYINYRIDNFDNLKNRLIYNSRRKYFSKFFGKIYLFLWRKK